MDLQEILRFVRCGLLLNREGEAKEMDADSFARYRMLITGAYRKGAEITISVDYKGKPTLLITRRKIDVETVS